MNVSNAITARKSIRAFLETPVSTSLLEQLLQAAARSPSGRNVQPWRIYVVNGPAMSRFREHLEQPVSNEPPAYEIYPQGLTEPYRSSRFKVGEDMYRLLGISREDRPARIRRLMENYKFFGAPAAIFCFIDRQMGPPQWSDLGMFLQSFMLLATEAGLGTCAQEAWATKAQTVANFVQAPAEQMLFCGVAIGYPDEHATVNDLVSDRAALANFATFLD